jgi:predicted metal-dependent phosphoesterase TrpH
VARALVEAGVVKTMREAFDRYLHDGGPADVGVERVALEEGLRLGREAGARMSLAHPHTLRDHGVVEEMLRTFRPLGLEGIEAWYGGYARQQREQWLRLARTHDLVVTAGSDFHGDANPDITRPGIDLPQVHASRLREWLVG